MWFKQISFYPLNKDKLPELEVLADKLAQSEFAHCQGLDWFSEGFATPVSFSPELVFPADYTWRIALKKEEKVLPAGVIRDILDEKVLEIQNNEARNVGRKEKQELKEQITDDLLPPCFYAQQPHTGDFRHAPRVSFGQQCRICQSGKYPDQTARSLGRFGSRPAQHQTISLFPDDQLATTRPL